MLSIKVPEETNTTTQVPLGGRTYSLRFTWNSVQQKHHMDILFNDVLIKAGIVLTDGSWLLSKYALDIFDGADMRVFKIKDTDAPVGRHNLGIDKDYELIYFTRDEMRS